MTEPHEHHGPPWAQGAGRRFRRGGLVVLLVVVLLVAVLASVAASIFTGNAPAPWITVVVSGVVIVGLVLSARWLWRGAHTVGALLDAADRVAGGDYTTRVEGSRSRQLGRLADGFNEMTARLETNEQRRREWLADVAHELRTPLQVIRGSVEGMLDGMYPADPEHLQPLVDETIVMARLLEDLRTLSMAEGGVLVLHRETVDPLAVVKDIVQRFGPMATEARVSLATELGQDAPRAIDADPVRLMEVLTNLLSNALRHTPAQGRITLGVSLAGRDGVAFEVSDTGPGISSEQLATVFDRFVTSADAGGTGLGLTIARRLVEAHGGTIEAGAPPEGGTRIRFMIPAG